MELPSFLITTGALLLFLLGISAVIFLHELGHFVVAKWVGIRCDQFAIGFGKAFLAWRKGIGLKLGSTEPHYAKKLIGYLNGRIESDPGFRAKFATHSAIEPVPIESVEQLSKLDPSLLQEAADELGLGETEYRLNYLPLGGYVKMLGQEDMDPNAMSDDPRAYNQKPIWARMCVISAGVIMNIITAVPIFMVAFMIGVETQPVILGGVDPGSPAAMAVAREDADVIGLQDGDTMLAIDGEQPTDFADLKMKVALAKPGDTLVIKVRRPSLDGGEGEVYTFDVEPVVGSQGLLTAGIMPASSLTVIKPKGKDSQALFDELLGRYAEPGATVTAVRGNAVDDYWQYDRYVQASGGEPITIATDVSDKPVAVPVSTGWQVGKIEINNKTTEVAHLLGLRPATKITNTLKKQPADGVLQKGDVIAAVNGRAWPTVDQFQAAVKQSEGDIQLTVVRAGQAEQHTITPNRKGLIGVAISAEFDTAYVSDVLADSPFAPIDLKPGTRISAVNGQTVESYTDLRRAIAAAGVGEASLTLREPLLGGVERQATLILNDETLAELAAVRWTTPLNGNFKGLELPIQTGSPVEAVALGYHKTKVFLVQTYVMLARLIQGSVPTDKLSGPLGIGRMGTTFAEKGFGHLLYFLGLISVNLAVINFLPLPIVDGGHFVLLLLEKIRGKPLPEPVMNGIMIVGLALLAFVFIYVTKNDIVNWSLLGGG